MSACTDEQQAEWSALHARMAELADATRAAEREAGGWLSWGIEHDDGEYAHRKALEEAAKAVAFWAERMELAAVVEAHPYTAEVQARRAVAS